MAVTVREMDCSPEAVFEVLSDGWLYPTWVVGASRMRDVDDRWPGPGAVLQHSFGVWPMLLDDETRMLEWSPPQRAVMQPKGRPIGEARVTLEVKPRGTGCVVRIDEVPVAGPGRWLHNPAMELAIHLRNVETLRRLAFIAENRTDQHGRHAAS